MATAKCLAALCLSLEKRSVVPTSRKGREKWGTLVYTLPRKGGPPADDVTQSSHPAVNDDEKKVDEEVKKNETKQ